MQKKWTYNCAIADVGQLLFLISTTSNGYKARLGGSLSACIMASSSMIGRGYYQAACPLQQAPTVLWHGPSACAANTKENRPTSPAVYHNSKLKLQTPQYGPPSWVIMHSS